MKLVDETCQVTETCCSISSRQTALDLLQCRLWLFQKFELKMDQKDVTIENSRLIGGESSTGGQMIEVYMA